jgi:hypothetical protein
MGMARATSMQVTFCLCSRNVEASGVGVQNICKLTDKDISEEENNLFVMKASLSMDAYEVDFNSRIGWRY